jgi:uncharacterized integral membrane protein
MNDYIGLVVLLGLCVIIGLIMAFKGSIKLAPVKTYPLSYFINHLLAFTFGATFLAFIYDAPVWMAWLGGFITGLLLTIPALLCNLWHYCRRSNS